MAVGHLESLTIVMGSLFGALIGYTANRLAIWMLFHPRRPVRLGPLVLQGVIPRKRREMAVRVAEVVARGVIREEEIVELVREAIIRELEASDNPLARLAPPVLRGLVTRIATALARALTSGVGARVDLKTYIISKMESMSDEELERVFYGAVGRELMFISLNDAIMGAVVGALEALLMTYMH